MPFKLTAALEGSSCKISVDRVHDGVILISIDGHDVGEFGNAPMRLVDALMPDAGTAMLFIDARQALGVTVGVSSAWANWLARSCHRFSHVHMLTSSRQVGVSAGFVRRFTELQGQMYLYTDASAFERLLVQAAA